jgi:hypothetical protein
VARFVKDPIYRTKVKNFLLAQMGFESEMRGIPEKYKKEVNDLIWKFLWAINHTK